MDKILIFGHRNPDTDSVCGAISLSYLKNKTGNLSIPCILGNINEETKYALNRFKVEVPMFLNDVKPQIKDVNFHKNYVINENRPINDAFNYMSLNGITGIPLVDNDKIFSGYVSLKEAVAEIIAKDIISINTSFDNLLLTLEGTDYVKIGEEINGMIDARHFEEINDSVDSNSIMIIRNDEKLIKKLIKLGVCLIVIVNTKKISAGIKKLAKDNKVNLLSTDYSLFKVSRTISLANPIKLIKRNTSTITYKDTDYLSDFLETTSKLKHTNYPIVNKKNVCLGMLRTIDAHEVKKKRVILVDHNSLEQSVDGLYEANILEIIDHHNIGSINTTVPVNFRNMSVGSVNTIIYHLYQEHKVKIPKSIAGLMLSGIVSDTLLLKSPTTTEEDKRIALDLANIAGVDINKYGLDLLSSGVSIEGVDDTDIIYRDFKKYKVNDSAFAVAQVFTTDFKDYKNRINSIVEELDKISEAQNYKCCCLFVTNFLTNNSYLLFSKNSKDILSIAYGIDDLKVGQMLKNVVSRKKQMVPFIMSALN